MVAFFEIILPLPGREAKAKKATTIASRLAIGNHFSVEKTVSSIDIIIGRRCIIHALKHYAWHEI